MGKLNFIDGNTLNKIVDDIENYIAKNYKLTALEYSVILDLLKQKLNARRTNEKKKNLLNGINFKDIMKKAREAQE